MESLNCHYIFVSTKQKNMTLKNVSGNDLSEMSSFMGELDRLMTSYCHITELLPKMFYNGMNATYDVINKEYSRREQMQESED